MTQQLSFSTRLWFAWACFFRVLSGGSFARSAWQLAHPGPSEPPTPALPLPPVAVPAMALSSATNGALQLLALLQREGRLVDFVEQDVAAFSDADVGAAARVVHEGCKRALHAHATIAPLRAEAEGSRVTLAEGFAVDEVKLSGNVQGSPPYTGILRHRGWRVRDVKLPVAVRAFDAEVVAPAELDL